MGDAAGTNLFRMKAKQGLVLRPYGLVALACRFSEGLHIGDLNFASGVLDDPGRLKRARHHSDAGSPNSQHLGKKFLSEVKSVAARQIPRP